MMRRLLLFYLTLISVGSLSAYGQTALTGEVRGEDGEPLSGVSVRLKGTSVGTTTTNQGTYVLNIPTLDGTLLFSSMGYETVEIQVSGRKTIHVTLASDVSELDEIIVTGYTSTARKDLTGAIGTVNMDDLQKAPVRSFEEALAGRVAGVQVTSQSGRPGSPIDIVIRGVGSISQSNQPLFVIDGFPIEDPDNNVIDPSDIESINVLKDASSTALYGARGSNGVIVITTKRGAAGAPKINYQVNYGINNPAKYMKLLNPIEFVKLQSELMGSQNPYLTDGKVLEDYRNEKGVDWQGMLLRTGNQQNHSIQLTGGNGGTRYAMSGNYFTQDGIIINSSFRRYQGKMALDQTVGKRLKVGGTITYTNNLTKGTNSQNNGGQSALFYQAFSYRPISISGFDDRLSEDLYDPEGNGVVDYRVNPVVSTKHEIRNNIRSNIVSTLYGEYQLLSHLKLKVRGSANNSRVEVQTLNGSKTRTGGALGSQGINGSLYNYNYDYYDNTNLLEYTNAFNDVHHLNVVLGSNVQLARRKSLGYSARQIPDESLGLSGIDAGVINTPPVNVVSSSTMASWIMSTAYNYKGKYYFTGNFRADGSSKFLGENKWGYFPSLAVKWKFSEEKFFARNDWMSDGNIRLSYGLTGNNRVGDFDTYSSIGFGSALTLYGNLLPNSAVVSSLQNPALKWESSESTNLGFDLGLFDQMISLTVDLYKRSTSDLLYRANLPGSTGYGNVIKNIAKISNKGLEISLNANVVNQSRFSYTTNFNISFNRNQLHELSDPNETAILTNIGWDPYYDVVPAYIAKVGGPLGQMYGLVSQGLYQYEDFDRLSNGSYVLKPDKPVNTFLVGNPQPGDMKFSDINGDGVVDADDNVVIGNGYPMHTGGWSNTFRYRNFDLNIFFQWSVGNNIINANRLFFSTGLNIFLRNTTMPGQNAFAEFADRWTPTNQDTDIPRLNRVSNRVYNTQFVEDGSFLRLKTINIGYTVPEQLLNRIKVKGLRLYVATSNLHTWTKYKGYDPELSAFQSALTPGLDFSTYPRPLTIVGGINLSI